MPADRRQSRVSRARGSGRQAMVNHISGGRGGSGGDGHGHGRGGTGGHGMGPSLSFDISVRHLTMHNNVHGDDDFEAGCHRREIAVGDTLPNSCPGPYIQQNIHQHGDRGIDILHRVVTLEAIHDSMDSFMEPQCHPETRTKMLKDLSDWVVDTHPKTTILWLYGPAGGDSGPAFFFKRGHATRGNARTLFTTIAYQLALNIEWLRAPISRVVEQTPSIVAQSMATQMQELISKPCGTHEHPGPVVILIDGLDECDGHNVQGEILRTIRRPSFNHPLFLRFMVASRPEPQIRQVFDPSSFHYHSFNVEQSFHDVHKYLRDEFSRIHHDHSTMAKIPSPWPEPSVLEMLVRKSSGYFIYASTIIKFIGDENFRPTVRLEVVQNTNGPGSESAYDGLDQLYMTILSSVPRQSELIPILCAIFKFGWCPKELDKLFRLAEGEALLLLRAQDKIEQRQNLLPPCIPGSVPPPVLCSTLSALIRFIVSLPPCDAVAELFPLVGSINPDYIFEPPANLHKDELASVAFWLKNAPSAPADLIQLWEDYAFMHSIDRIHSSTEAPSVEQIGTPSPELLRILVSLGFLGRPLGSLPTKLDLTWIDLRKPLCNLRPKVFGDVNVLPVHRTQTTSPWAARDLALHLIRKMVKNHVDTDDGVNPAASRGAVWILNAYPSICNLKGAYTKAQLVSIM
ncbi:putative nwd2 protein [Mycena sanguinolenta]|uniref:Putative nwd2 protein n=1 Tax=Mycena sanguinolenta TaxID=230812 RepID=A0A8H7CFW6_9AGAR|nr:putative nwd2 protein [Mycena sanguinolenta]